MNEFNSDHALAEAQRHVRHLQKLTTDRGPVGYETRWIHAASSLGAISVESNRVTQFGLSVSMQSLAEASYPAPFAAHVIALSFALMKGRPVRLLAFADAAVLDWSWKNQQTGTIQGQAIEANAHQIQLNYGLPNSFGAPEARESIGILKRNGSLIDWGSDQYHLAEKVTIWQ